MKKFFVVILLAVMSAGLFAQSNAAEELAAAERAFSASSERHGINASFLEFLDDDCVMFAPLPVNGKELYRHRKETGAHLTWHPVFVEAARSGDVGISTGPWQIRRSKNDTVGAYGHYFSVWRKRPDGQWKVVLDNGIGYPRSEWRKESAQFRMVPAVRPAGNAARQGTMLMEEQRFSHRVAAAGLRTGIEEFAAEDIRYYRQENFPVTGKNGIRGTVGTVIRPRKDSVYASHVASSGDLGYCYGVRVEEGRDTTVFIHVWRKEQHWKLAVMLEEEFRRP